MISTDPKAYATVAPGSIVNVTVSTGKVAIPDEAGKKQADATVDLNNQGWPNVVIKQVPTTDQTKDGLVQSVSPAAGSVFRRPSRSR